MRSIRSVLLLLALPVLGCGGGPSAPAALFELPPEVAARVGATEGPDLFVGRAAVDFGRIWQGAAREVVFPLTSSGTEPAHIKALRAGCGCTLAQAVVVTPEGPRELVLDEPLAPGTRVEVTVRYDSRGREGTESKPVMVYHDGPAGRAALEVGVQVEPFLISETNPLTFGRLYLDGAEEQRTTLSSSTGEPFGLSVQLRGHAQPGLELSLEPSAPGPDGRAASWQLIARLDPVGLAGPGGLLENPDPSALGGQNLIAAVVLETDVPLPDPGPVDPGTPAHHFLDLAVTATLLAPVQASTGYLSFGFLAPGAATSSSVRIECFAPELAEAFRAAEPTVEVLDGEGAVPDWAGNFTPTLRLVEPEAAGNRPLTPGALCAWDLEVLGRGFRGGDRNRVTGRVVLDFGGELLPDQSMAFQAMLQP